jgi:S-sulfo-L-cysteine synthase (O-acetyl-L-serine-dependent)
VGRRLRALRPDILNATVIPELFPGIEGLKPFGAPDDLVPAILDESLIDTRIRVSNEQALAMCRRLACSGLFIGPSSGAYVHAALEIAATNRYRTLATVLSDTGERYSSTGMWAVGAQEESDAH